MAQLDPAAITMNDIVLQALKECGALGIGQTASADQLVDGWFRLQTMLQEWQRKKYMVFHMLMIVIPSTGAGSYSVGPGGAFSTGIKNRPERIDAAFLRFPGNPYVDRGLDIVDTMEDYAQVAEKGNINTPYAVFYDAAWPIGTLFPIPIAAAGNYSLGIVIKDFLPIQFLTAADQVNLPPDYFSAILYNLALRLRGIYKIGTYPGDQLPLLAANGIATVKSGNSRISTLSTSRILPAGRYYNIYTDT